MQIQRPADALRTRLMDVMMSELVPPCDLGDGIEVLHDVELIEVEMECDLNDDSAPYDRIEVHSGIAPCDDLTPPERVLTYGALDLGAYVRSPIMDTLPFALEEPIAVSRVVASARRVARGTGPVDNTALPCGSAASPGHARLVDAKTTPFVRPPLPPLPMPPIETATVPYEKYSAPFALAEPPAIAAKLVALEAADEIADEASQLDVRPRFARAVVTVIVCASAMLLGAGVALVVMS